MDLVFMLKFFVFSKIKKLKAILKKRYGKVL
jgi:hypothetical protein